MHFRFYAPARPQRHPTSSSANPASSSFPQPPSFISSTALLPSPAVTPPSNPFIQPPPAPPRASSPSCPPPPPALPLSGLRAAQQGVGQVSAVQRAAAWRSGRLSGGKKPAGFLMSSGCHLQPPPPGTMKGRRQREREREDVEGERGDGLSE